jgi:hypothetical protein
MRNAIARRLKRLEELEFQHRAELAPSLSGKSCWSGAGSAPLPPEN